ncbi:MAG TPA: hypothetical protein HPP87_02305 [Planctomycetes bacterium]|nr:hypothetical protein [Planctomycetota bacterium]HIJ70179.1 hypothetical protein [Planctomycetota bacterium]
MARPGNKKRISSHGSGKISSQKQGSYISSGQAVLERDGKAEKYFAISTLVILLGFGVYKSIALYGAYPVPNPDFPGFVQVGRQLLRFKVPWDFKRLPMVGIMQVLLSHLMPGDQPVLTAGWVINGIFSALSVVLLWRVGKRIIGESAIWVAVVAMLNPWVLRSQINPIAETSMIFFTLTTFFFMFRSSSWVYLFACFASMVRYECAALIPIAFVMDMIKRKGARQRLLAVLWAGIASVPMGLWMLGTKMAWQQPGARRAYIGDFTGKSHLGMKYVETLWDATFKVALQLPAGAKAMFVRTTSAEAASAAASMNTLVTIAKIITAGAVIVAIFWGIYRKKWNVVALILFFGIYVGIHAARKATHQRYCVPVIWLAILLCAYGLKGTWRTINIKKWIPKPMVVLLQAALVAGATVWLVMLIPYMQKLAPFCEKGKYLPYVAGGVLILVVIVRVFLFKLKFLGRDLAVTAVVLLMIVSSHFTTARVIDNGIYYIEFKYMLDWYKANAKPGERLATRWTHVLKLMTKEHGANIMELTRLKSDSFEGFIENCYQNDIVYVACNSRGSSKTKRGLAEVREKLVHPRSVGPFEIVQRIEISRDIWINIFRLHRPQERLNDT